MEGGTQRLGCWEVTSGIFEHSNREPLTTGTTEEKDSANLLSGFAVGQKLKKGDQAREGGGVKSPLLVCFAWERWRSENLDLICRGMSGS